METDIVFLFGAGVECGKECYGLPSGADYTIRTMRTKNERLYRELRTFYRKRLSESAGNGYVGTYKNSFLFEKDSHTFREIIYRAALRWWKECGENYNYGEYSEYVQLAKENQLLEQMTAAGSKTGERSKEVHAKLRNCATEIYGRLIQNEKNIASNESIDKKQLKDYVEYYGAVEKDFSSIISPQDVGLTQFWRIINYFWSAFFVILEPLCKQFTWYESSISGDKQSFYKYVLEHLCEVIVDVYTNYDYSRVENSTNLNKNYYKILADAFQQCTVITTNYTPFVEHYFPAHSIYLAGKLSEFEFPTELTVKNICKEQLDEEDFVFPFLMTQAPVKPIVVPEQIRQYQSALDVLDRANTLIIVGYSLGNADNHINAMLREFAVKPQKKIIYCNYCRDSDAQYEDAQKRLCKSLRISQDINSIQVVNHLGNAADLTEELLKCK